jgi:hypothetical protein
MKSAHGDERRQDKNANPDLPVPKAGTGKLV